MKKQKTNKALTLIFSLLVSLCLFAPLKAQAAADFNASEMILEHIGDSYEWHFTNVGETPVAIPLPVIVYSQVRGEWFCFSSHHLEGGEEYQGFRIAREGDYEGKVVETDAQGQEVRPVDISLTKNAVALLINSALLIAILTFSLGAYVIPKSNVTRLEFENTYKKKKTVDTAHNIQMELEDDVIAYFDRFEKANNTGYRFTLDRFEGNTLKSHFTAKTLVYQDDAENPNLWKAKNWQLRTITDTLEVITSGLALDTLIAVQPYDLTVSKDQQETLTSPQLKKYIDRQRKRGMGNIKAFEVEYHKRIATSFAAFILTLIGVSLSSKKVKGGMGLNLGVGIALSFGYILFQTISSTFAINGSTPPVVAVWMPNILFLLIGIWLYWRAPK